MARTLVFDLDGTLVDSVPDLTAALNLVLAEDGLVGFTAPEVTRMVGDGVAALLARGYAARGHTPGPTAEARFMATYGAHVADASQPYPGVAAGLAGLAASGWRLAVCTNKPAALAHDLLATLGLAPLFAAIGGGDSFAVRKPDPAHLLATLALAGGTADGAVMVGDHANDVTAATGAGIACIFVTWGYGTVAMRDGAMRDGAVAVVDRFEQIPLLLGWL